MKAHQLLADPARFCARAWALKEDGNNTLAISPEAVRWDASGAIQKCYGLDTPEQKHAWKMANDLARARYDLSLAQVCDRIGYEEALAILKEVNV